MRGIRAIAWLAILLASSAWGFYSRGRINEYLAFDNLEIPRAVRPFPGPEVRVTLVNLTGEPVSVLLVVRFRDIHGTTYNQAFLRANLEPRERLPVRGYLEEPDTTYARSAYEAQWEVAFLKVGDRIVK